MQDFSFLACREVAEKFVVEWSGGDGLGQFLGSALVKLNNKLARMSGWVGCHN